jgi:hypothetical protein
MWVALLGLHLVLAQGARVMQVTSNIAGYQINGSLNPTITVEVGDELTFALDRNACPLVITTNSSAPSDFLVKEGVSEGLGWVSWL